MTTMGVGRSAMIRRVVSSPSMPGRRMSIEITSGRALAIDAKASSPEATAATSSSRGSRETM